MITLQYILKISPLHQQRCKSTSGATAERVEDQESLQSGASIGKTTDTVERLINQLLADRVVTAWSTIL